MVGMPHGKPFSVLSNPGARLANLVLISDMGHPLLDRWVLPGCFQISFGSIVGAEGAAPWPASA